MNEIELKIHQLEIRIRELQLEQDALRIDLLKQSHEQYIKSLNN